MASRTERSCWKFTMDKGPWLPDGRAHHCSGAGQIHERLIFQMLMRFSTKRRGVTAATTSASGPTTRCAACKPHCATPWPGWPWRDGWRETALARALGQLLGHTGWLQSRYSVAQGGSFRVDVGGVGASGRHRLRVGPGLRHRGFGCGPLGCRAGASLRRPDAAGPGGRAEMRPRKTPSSETSGSRVISAPSTA